MKNTGEIKNENYMLNKPKLNEECENMPVKVDV